MPRPAAHQRRNFPHRRAAWVEWTQVAIGPGAGRSNTTECPIGVTAGITVLVSGSRKFSVSLLFPRRLVLHPLLVLVA